MATKRSSNFSAGKMSGPVVANLPTTKPAPAVTGSAGRKGASKPTVKKTGRGR